jgi:hypothetical protein
MCIFRWNILQIFWLQITEHLVPLVFVYRYVSYKWRVLRVKYKWRVVTGILRIGYIFQAGLKTLHQNIDSKESYAFGRRLHFRRCWKVDAVFISGLGFSFKRNKDMTTNGEWRSCLFGFYHTNQLKLQSRGPVSRPTTETYRLLHCILHTVILTGLRHLSRLVANDLGFNWLFETG